MYNIVKNQTTWNPDVHPSYMEHHDKKSAQIAFHDLEDSCFCFCYGYGFCSCYGCVNSSSNSFLPFLNTLIFKCRLPPPTSTWCPPAKNHPHQSTDCPYPNSSATLESLSNKNQLQHTHRVQQSTPHLVSLNKHPNNTPPSHSSTTRKNDKA